jgi:succinate dehydrogenase / fumarate reductase cytochrome b subunit
MAASILHRATGVVLYGGALLLAAWLAAAAMGPQAYEPVWALMLSLPGQILLFLFTIAVSYHFANGIRHLMWDGPGVGFSPKVASAVSVFNMAFALVAACGLWSLAYFF